MTEHPIENLLRTPHERWSALAYGFASAITVMSPSVLMGALHTPSLTYSLAGGLAVCAWHRGRQASALLNYQYGMVTLPPFVIAPSDIPQSQTDLYLGRGFEWTARHTQRRADFERRENDHHRRRAERRSYKIARSLERMKPALLGGVVSLVTACSNSWNPLAPVPYVEGLPQIHGVGLWEGEHDIYQKQSERVAHLAVYGTTRQGKSRLAEVLIKQDIHNGEVVIVFDPKGDPDLMKRTYVEAVKAGRVHQFRCFHLGYPEVSARYNPVGTFERVTEPASRIASQLPGEGQSAAFREFTWRYVNVMAKALTTLGRPITYETLLQYGADIDPLLLEYLSAVFDRPGNKQALTRAGFGNWRHGLDEIANNPEQKPDRTQASRDKRAWAATQIYKRAGIIDGVAHALIKTFEYEKSFYDKLVASLFPLLEKLTSGPVSELLSPNYLDLDDPRPIFDWDEVIRTGGIVYVGLDALADAEVSQAVGNSMFSDLTSRAGALYKHGVAQGLPDAIRPLAQRRAICIHADEFNELVGKEFIPMANKAGGANFRLTVYTQTLSDIRARFGDEARAGQVIGNLGNLIMLRVKEPATAKLLTDLLPEVDVNHLMLMSGVTDNPDAPAAFTSSTQQRITTQRVPLVDPGDLTRLPKGHAFAMLGGKLYKLRLAQLSDTAELPSDLSFLYNEMQKRYETGTATDDWLGELRRSA